MKVFAELFRERSSYVKTQIIQTVSIVLMNIQREHSLCKYTILFQTAPLIQPRITYCMVLQGFS
jgi:hypothetical protein